MRDYFINFWVWWYLIKVPDLTREVLDISIFTLELTNVLPMARNLLVPLFQDTSGIGKALSLIIRGIWVWLGGMLSLLIIIPLGCLLVLAVLLPVITVVQIILGVISIIV